MKKKYRGIVISGIILLVCTAAFSVYYLFFVEAKDRVAPVISVPEGQIDVSVSAPDEVLMQNITAVDDEDGDVTSSMLVESVSNISEEDIVEVSVAAFDRSGNVSKAVRQVHYTDYHSPRFKLSAPLLFRESTNFDVLSCISVDDLIDGNLNDRIKTTLVSEAYSVDVAGEYQIMFRVTNSLNDTETITLPVEVYGVDAYDASVTLTDYLVYLKKGAPFDPEDYLKVFVTGLTEYSLKDKEALKELKIGIDSNVDMDTPGIYMVNYTVSNEEYRGGSRLMVVVED